MLGQIEADILSDRQRIEQGAGLEDHRLAIAGNSIGRLKCLAVYQDVPRIRHLQADEVPQQDRLATAARTHDHKNLPRLNLEVETLKHFVPIVAFSEAADLEPDARLLGEIAHDGHLGNFRGFALEFPVVEAGEARVTPQDPNTTPP